MGAPKILALNFLTKKMARRTWCRISLRHLICSKGALSKIMSPEVRRGTPQRAVNKPIFGPSRGRGKCVRLGTNGQRCVRVVGVPRGMILRFICRRDGQRKNGNNKARVPYLK